MRLDAIGACVVLGAAMLAIISRNTLSPSLAALTISEALDVTMFLKAAVTSGAMFETRFNSGACPPGYLASWASRGACCTCNASVSSPVVAAQVHLRLHGCCMLTGTCPHCRPPPPRVCVFPCCCVQWSAWCTTGACPRRRQPPCQRRSLSRSGPSRAASSTAMCGCGTARSWTLCCEVCAAEAQCQRHELLCRGLHAFVQTLRHRVMGAPRLMTSLIPLSHLVHHWQASVSWCVQATRLALSGAQAAARAR
jgi:hypothetical protein